MSLNWNFVVLFYLFFVQSVSSFCSLPYNGPLHFEDPDILHNMKLSVQPAHQEFEFVLSNRNTTHFSMDTAKGESRKWHGLASKGWITLTNFWLDIPEEKATPAHVHKTKVYPHKIQHDIHFQNGHKRYTEEFWMSRNKESAVLRYQARNFQSQVYFRPVFGFRKDWESEANAVNVEFDGCTLFANVKNPKRAYDGPKFVGIRVLDYSQFHYDEQYPKRSYWRDEQRSDVGPYRYVYEAGRLQTVLTENSPLLVIMSWADSKYTVNEELNKLQREMGKYWEETTRPLVELIESSRIRSDDPSFTKAIQWSYASLDSLTMDTNGKGIYAGIPWFNQYWGRDSFISFPGTLLTTFQSDLAKEFIFNMAHSQDKNPQSKTYGRVPNILQPRGSTFANNYETTDGTGWWIRSIWYYFMYNGMDQQFLEKIWPNIEIALEGAMKRTDVFGFLLHEPRETWMDAMHNNFIITPRHDRAVEIQALHYTALDIGSRLAKILGMSMKVRLYEDAMKKLKLNFLQMFWNEKDQDLFDHLKPNNQPSLQKRPNMIYAVTVPLEDNPLIDDETARKVLHSVVKFTVAPHGIRTLSPNDPEYRRKHDGTGQHHDFSYHNGDVWPFLSGPVIEASLRLGERKTANHLTKALVQRCLTKDTLGSIEEILDGDDSDPLGHSRGAYSQAWSLAEFVRTAHQFWMGVRPEMVSQSLSMIQLDMQMPDEILFMQSNFLCSLGKVSFERQKMVNGLQQVIFVNGFEDQRLAIRVTYRLPTDSDQECVGGSATESFSNNTGIVEPVLFFYKEKYLNKNKISMIKSNSNDHLYEFTIEIPKDSNSVSFILEHPCLKNTEF